MNTIFNNVSIFGKILTLLRSVLVYVKIFDSNLRGFFMFFVVVNGFVLKYVILSQSLF